MWIGKLVDVCLELQGLREFVGDMDLYEKEREAFRWRRQQELIAELDGTN